MKEADPKIDDNGNGKEVRRLIEKSNEVKPHTTPPLDLNILWATSATVRTKKRPG
jgi:hypothetical protein